MEERIDEAQEDVVALRSNVELAEEVSGGGQLMVDEMRRKKASPSFGQRQRRAEENPRESPQVQGKSRDVPQPVLV